MQHHNVDLIGPLALNGNEGLIGQVPVSAGPGNQVTWLTLPTPPSIGKFVGTAAAATTFTITHNLNNSAPITAFFRTDTTPPEQIIPKSVKPTSANVLEVTLSVARPLAFTIMG